MPGQNTVVAQNYMDQYDTVSYPLHGSTITLGAVTPLFQLEKDIVIDDVRLITRIAGASGLTLDVGFLPGATPCGSTWTGTYNTATSTTVTIASTVTGSLNIGDRLGQLSGGVLSQIPQDAYIVSFGTYTVAAGTGTVIISAAASGTASGWNGVAFNWKSILTAPMLGTTGNSVIVGAVNANSSTIPTAAPSNLTVTTANNIVQGPTTSGTTTVVGKVLGILASGGATTNYIGTLQIRYRTRIA